MASARLRSGQSRPGPEPPLEAAEDVGETPPFADSYTRQAVAKNDCCGVTLAVTSLLPPPGTPRPMEELQHPHTFIVRLTRGDGGVVSGVVERVRTGEKQRFHSLAVLADVIAEMTERETQATRQKKRAR